MEEKNRVLTEQAGDRWVVTTREGSAKREHWFSHEQEAVDFEKSEKERLGIGQFSKP